MKLRKGFHIISLFLLAAFMAGCGEGTKSIKVEYLPDFVAQRIHDGEPIELAFNGIWDERPRTDRIGDGYNAYGGRTETWVSDDHPVKIIEDALIKQFENAGFRVVRTSGWNLSADSIPDWLNADYIVGGRLRAFWVESRPGVFTVSVSSNVTFDLVIADVRERRILWAGQFTGTDKGERFIRTAEAMRESINRSVTQAVNSTFQDASVRAVLIRMAQVSF